MANKSRLEVQELDPYCDEWDTGDFPFMTKEQLFKVMHKTINDLLSVIEDLKKELRWGKFVDDVMRQAIVNSLIKELQKRFFEKEVIPVTC